MRAACEDGEGGDRLEHAAHTLKANARTFGAERLGRLCRRLEERGRTGRTGEEATAALVTEAEDAFEQVREAVEAYRAPA
jgi:HPt (histidine-containing phosphotransfer) domain-containing protein